MKGLIEDFSKQLLQAHDIGEKAGLSGHAHEIRTVVIAGLGGSGIGASIAADLVRGHARFPILVVKGYEVPAFVDEHTLVIASSYSGTTEETVQFLKTAIERGSKIVCIATGGEIGKIAIEKKLDHIEIPSGIPPRAGLSYSLVQILYILSHFGATGSEFKNELISAAKLLDAEEANIQTEAHSIAKTLEGKIPVIYASLEFEGVTIRFRQQLNENAKTLAWSAVLPEMNHNELVGWSQKNDSLSVVIFRNSFEYERIAKRIEITKEVVSKYAHVTEITAKGTSFLEQTLYQIHMGDWISYFLSELVGCDPIAVKAVDYLKSKMNEPKKE